MIAAKQQVSAFAYVRMSTDKQGASPAQQREHIAAMADRSGFRIVRWFADEGITGDSIEERPEFVKMLKAAQRGEAKAILVWDLSRFGRLNVFKAGAVVSPLVDAGIQLVTVAEGPINWDDFAGQMMFMLHTGGNHKFLKDLSRNVVRGKMSRIRAGSFIGSAPIGMCRVFFDQSGKEVARAERGERFRRAQGWSCRLAPTNDPSRIFERDAVVWAFHTYAFTGAGTHCIAKGLRARGLTGRGGTPIVATSIFSILKNPHYTGTLVVGKSRRGKYHWVGRDGQIDVAAGGAAEGSKRVGVPAVEIPDAHEGLISAEVFSAVQDRLSRNRSRYQRAGSKTFYLLSGVLRCGTCGSPMHGHFTKGGFNRNAPANLYYGCKGWGMHLGCTTFRGAEIEAYVVRLLDALITSPAARDRICEAIRRRMRAQPESDAKQLGRSLGEIERRIAVGRRNLFAASEEDVEPMKAMLVELRQARKRIEAMLRAPAPGRKNETAERAAAEAIDHISKSIEAGDKRLAAEIIREVFEGITIYRRKIGSRCYFVRGRAVLRSSIGPLAALNLHGSIESLRSIPILRDIRAAPAP